MATDPLLQLTSGDMPNLRAALEAYGIALRNAYQDNLIRSDRIATGALLNSVETRVQGPDGNAWAVTFRLEEYWKWIEDDTRPHWPPPAALLKWIEAKPVIPRPDARGRIPSPKSLAFLIGRKISKSGTKGSHDLERAERDLPAEWMRRIGDALQKDLSEGLNIYIVETFREINPAPVEM